MKFSTSRLFSPFWRLLPVLLLAIPAFISCQDTSDPKMGSVKFVFNTQECASGLIGTVTIRSKTASVRTENALTAECNRFSQGEKISLEAGMYDYVIQAAEGRSWNGTVTISEGACEIVTIGCPVTTGLATFWLEEDLGCGPVYVSIPGYGTEEIYYYSSGGAPSCESEGYASFELEAGTYPYTASCSYRSWQGEVQVSRNSCNTVLLSEANSGGGGHGEATFWINQDFGCGPLTINVSNQYTGTINYFYATEPSCGAEGCANFTLEPGTYTYQASCSGYTWPQYSFTVYANDCASIQIY